MLLAIDAGNSAVKLGIFHGPELLKSWRLDHDALRTPLDLPGLNPKDVAAIIISSVVPSLNDTLHSLAENQFNVTPVFVDHTMETGLTILYKEPSELGVDRIVDAVAAVEKYGAPCIVLDFGTATTFNAINSKREYLGGIIAPGIMTSAEALFSRAAKLPRVAIERPQNVIGTSTIDAMQSGLFYGYAGMIDGLLDRMLDEMKDNPKIIATGGLAPVVQHATKHNYHIDETLTLDGLRILYEMNKA
jgi:type III pantothenate kinase